MSPREPDPGEEPKHSWGNVGDHHWSRSRKGMNEESLEYYRERSKAPGVAEGGGLRNAYCMECDGVIPIEYDSSKPADRDVVRTCPHCGAALDPGVQRMFNWVEIDQPPAGDAKAILLVGAAVLAIVAAVIVLGWWLYGVLAS